MLPRLIIFFSLIAGRSAAGEPPTFPFTVDTDALSGAADFSNLNHPLTAADRVFVRDSHFHTVGPDLKPFTEDDVRVRMFGVNLAFSGNFPEEKDAVRIARRLRRIGVNLVRFHHMDTSPDSKQEDARSILTTGPYPTFNPLSIRRLRVFLGTLKAEGIYANINLHVGYRFRPEIDQVPALPGPESIPTHSKPLHMLNHRMVELQTVFARRLLNELQLKGDPTLAMVEINNETSLLWHWMTGSLDRSLQGEYRKTLEQAWSNYLAGHQLTAIPWQAAKEDIDDEPRNHMARFLAGLDRAYLEAMRQAVRETTDHLVPIAGTQMGFSGLMLLDSHATMDYHDEHFYIDHYNFPNRSWDGNDWRIRNSSAVGTGLGRILSVAAAMPAGKPYTVSEFNENWPNSSGSEIDVVLSAIGAFQDWDSIMHFAYAHNRDWDSGLPNGFDLSADSTKLVNVGQSAWIFRTGAFTPARTIMHLPAGPSHRLRFTRERRAGGIMRYYESQGLHPLHAFLRGVRLSPSDDGPLPKEWGEKPKGPLVTESGEMTFDPDRRTLLLHASKAAGAIGHLGGSKVVAGPLEIEISANSPEFLTVLLTAVDNRPLAASGRMLLTLPGATWRSRTGSEPPQPVRLVNYPGTTDWFTFPSDVEGRPSGSRGGTTSGKPLLMDRAELALTLRHQAAKLTVYPLGSSGERLAPLPSSQVQKLNGGWHLRLNGENQPPSPWFEFALE